MGTSSRSIRWISIAQYGLLAGFFLLSLFSARHKSITIDEAKHYQYGLRILNLNSDRLGSHGSVVDDSKMPFTAINALPAKLAPYLPEGWLKRFSVTIQAGRPFTILFSVVTAFFMFHWARRLYGEKAALFSLFLYALEPSIIAHSHFVTTDIYAMGMMMLTVYALWHFNQRPGLGRLLLVAVLLGLSQLAKYTLVYLAPLVAAMQLAHDLPEWAEWVRTRDWRPARGRVRRYLEAGVVFTLVGLLIINAGYLFNRSLTPLQDYEFISWLFHGIQVKLGFLGWLPIPLPYPYLQGLDLVAYRDQTGYGVSRILLLGHLSAHGWPGYYFIDLAIKTPLPLLIAVMAGLILYIARKPGWRGVLTQESFLLIPIIWALVYMNYFLHAQVGIRLILVMFPFMLILAGNLVRRLSLSSKPSLILTAVLSAWLVVSVARFYPHFLAYSSELVWDKREAYLTVANGEFDWGQSRRYLDDWLKQHPDAIMDPAHPVVGTIVATPKLITGTKESQNPDKYAWLRDNFDPVDVIAYTYPVFHVTTEDLQRLGLTPTPQPSPIEP